MSFKQIFNSVYTTIYQLCFITGDNGDVEYRNDNNSAVLTSPSIELCENVVTNYKKQEQTMRKKPLWCIKLRSSTTASAFALIDNLDQFAVRELSIKETSLDTTCMLTLSKKFIKMKKLLFKSSSFPTGRIKEVINALAHPNTSLEGLFLWNVPITDDDVHCLSEMLSNNKTLKTLDLSNCDITDEGVQFICKGVAKNETLTFLAFSNNLKITSVSTSAIIELIKANTSLNKLYLRNTSLKYDDIKTICHELVNKTTIQLLVLSKQHENICKTFPSLIDRLNFVMDKSGMYYLHI